MGLWIVDHTKSEQIKGLRKVLQALPAAKLHIVRAFNVIRDLTRPKDSMLSNNSSYKVHQLGASPHDRVGPKFSTPGMFKLQIHDSNTFLSSCKICASAALQPRERRDDSKVVLLAVLSAKWIRFEYEIATSSKWSSCLSFAHRWRTLGAMHTSHWQWVKSITLQWGSNVVSCLLTTIGYTHSFQ